MKALFENKLVTGTLIGIIVLVGLWGLWKVLNGETSNTTSTQSDTVVDLKVNDSDWKKGSASPSATLVEYSDFQCPACKAYAPIVKAFVEKHKDTLQLVYRHYPLQQHAHAQLAATYAEAAGLQGKFFEMHDKLFDGQTTWEKSTKPEDIFISYAKELKLDLDKLKKDVKSNEVLNSISADLSSGTSAGVNATPTFFLNGKKLTSPQSLDDFDKLLE